MDYAQFVGKGFGPAWRGLLFRREYKDLADIITRTKKWFPRIFPGCRWLESQAHHKWIFPWGEELLLRTIKREGDYWSYHGQEFPWVGFDELTTWRDLECYHVMKSVCRSSYSGMPRHYRSTANPYGPGHNAVKDYFRIDVVKPFQPFEGPTGTICTIRGYIQENQILLRADPNYMKILIGDMNLNRRKAWVEGDWSVMVGGMFDDLWDSDIHMIPPFEIPRSWYIDRSFDWGSSRPFSVGWWAQSDGTQVELANHRKANFPRGTLFRIYEWYGWNGQPNKGSGMVDSAIGRGIIEREEDLSLRARCHPGPADSAIFDETNNDSPAKRMERAGVTWVPANKGPGTRKKRWQLMRSRMEASLKSPMEESGLFIFDACKHFARTVPSLVRDETDPDDIDDESEDHIADESGYRCLHKPRRSSSGDLKGLY